MNRTLRAGVIICVLGAVIGMLYGFARSPLADGGGPGFLAWLQLPEYYWPWPVFGAVISGLTYYATRLLRP